MIVELCIHYFMFPVLYIMSCDAALLASQFSLGSLTKLSARADCHPQGKQQH